MNNLAFESLRKAMVDSQIRPNKVFDLDVISAFSAVPKEIFVPKQLQDIAYIDEDINLSGGRCIMEAMIMGRLFQSLNLIQSANASSALAEWNNYCSSLTTAELRDVMNEAGLADVYAINPSSVSAATVSGFVRRMFYSDLDNNSRDDDGNVGYLIIGCARRGDTASVQIIQAANTSGIWRLVRADAN